MSSTLSYFASLATNTVTTHLGAVITQKKTSTISTQSNHSFPSLLCRSVLLPKRHGTLLQSHFVLIRWTERTKVSRCLRCHVRMAGLHVRGFFLHQLLSLRPMAYLQRCNGTQITWSSPHSYGVQQQSSPVLLSLFNSIEAAQCTEYR